MFRSVLNDEIVSHFPNDFRNYYEPFCGNDPVFFSMAREFDNPKDCFLSDIDHYLIRFLIALRDEPEILTKTIERLCQNKDKEQLLQHCKENEHVPACYFYSHCTYENRAQALPILSSKSVHLNRWAKGYSSIVTSGWQWIVNHVSEGDVVYLYPPDYNESFKTNGFNKADHIFLKNMCLQFAKKKAKVFVRTEAKRTVYFDSLEFKSSSTLSDGSRLYVYE